MTLKVPEITSTIIVILQYNESAATIRCLESLKELDHHGWRAVIVDNASQPEHLHNIKQWLSNQDSEHFQLIANPENLGYSGGNNVGIEYALKHGADYVVLLNNDVELKYDTLSQLVEVAEQNPGAGIVAPALIDEDGHMTYDGKIRWLRTELPLSSTPPPRPLLERGFYLSGACLLIKRQVFQTISTLDEGFFLYFEDVDFCYRAQLAGFQLMLLPHLRVRHWTSSSTKKLGSPLLARYHVRNALFFNSLNAPARLKLGMIFWASWVALKQHVKLIFIRNFNTVARAKATLGGIGDFYRERMGKIYV